MNCLANYRSEKQNAKLRKEIYNYSKEVHGCFSFVELDPEEVRSVDPNKVRNICLKDFQESIRRIRPSVAPSTLIAYDKWNSDYGDTTAF